MAGPPDGSSCRHASMREPVCSTVPGITTPSPPAMSAWDCVRRPLPAIQQGPHHAVRRVHVTHTVVCGPKTPVDKSRGVERQIYPDAALQTLRIQDDAVVLGICAPCVCVCTQRDRIGYSLRTGTRL